MSTIRINPGCQEPKIVPQFEAAIQGQVPHYTKVLPPEEGKRTDELIVEAYTLHKFGTTLIDLSKVRFEEMEGPAGKYWFGKREGTAIHLTGGLVPINGLVAVDAELRVKRVYPQNRPQGAQKPSASYALVVELSANSGSPVGQLVIEKSNIGPNDGPLLDPGRRIFAASWICVKQVQIGRDQPKPPQSPRRDGRADGHRNHRGHDDPGGDGGPRWGGQRRNRW